MRYPRLVEDKSVFTDERHANVYSEFFEYRDCRRSETEHAFRTFLAADRTIEL
jgi:hypothetical protein